MRNYTEYTKEEKESIIKNGGDKRKQLEKALSNWLDSMTLDDDIRYAINTADPLVEVFGTCESKEDVIAVYNELFKDE